MSIRIFLLLNTCRFIELNSLLAWLIRSVGPYILLVTEFRHEISSQVLELGAEGHKSVVVDFNILCIIQQPMIPENALENE